MRRKPVYNDKKCRCPGGFTFWFDLPDIPGDFAQWWPCPLKLAPVKITNHRNIRTVNRSMAPISGFKGLALRKKLNI